MPEVAKEFTFLGVEVRDENGNVANEKFFVGPLPKIGQAVEMVYVGLSASNPDMMRLMLRTKA